jgi:group I intron endonuclease
MKIRIYKITNLVNGKIYIGKTKKPIKKRLVEHRNSHNAELRNDMCAYGLHNFTINLLEFCAIEQSNDRERHYISFYNATDPAIGYNKTFGGDGGDCMSLLPFEKKKQLSVQLSQRAKRMWNDPNYAAYQKVHSKGLKRSEETKAKMSAALKIAQNRPEVKRKKSESQHRAIMNNRMIRLIDSLFY